MLWRAGSGHRHSFLSPFHPQSRWIFISTISNLAALSPSSGTERANLHPNSHPVFPGKIPRNLISKFPPETSRILAVIGAMSSTTMDRDQMLQHLPDTSSNVLGSSKTVCAFAQEVVERSCPEYALQILHISHRLGIRLAHNQYEQVVYRLAIHKHWGHAYRVAAMAAKLTGRWTTRLLNLSIRSHIEMQHYDLLSEALELFQRDQVKPTRHTYHLLVRGHLQNSDLARARNCLASMRDAGFKVDETTYTIVLGAYRALGPNGNIEQQAFQTLRGIGDPSDAIVLNSIMQLRIDEEDTAGALRVLELFALSPSSSGEQNGYGAAKASMTPRTSPDNATFNILMEFLARRQDGLQNVLRVFGQIPAVGLRPNVETVAALVRAHFTAGMASTAVAIVAEMCTIHDFPINPKEFQLLGRRAVALDTNMLHALSARPTTHIFNTLLQGVLPEHGIMGMRTVLRIMQQAAVNLDSSTTHIILSYLHDVQHIRPRNLIRVLRTLASFRINETSITTQHSNAIFRALLRRERDIVRTKSWSATAQRVRFGHRSSFSVDRLSKPAETFDPTAGISLKTYRRSVRKIFEPVIQVLCDRKINSDSMAFSLGIRRNALIRADLDSAQRLFDVMIARGIRPNAYHFSALMEGHVARGDMDAAKEVMNRAAHSSVAPNVIMHTILIIGYARMGRPDLAMRTFGEMRSAGVDPDFAAIDAVVSAYWFVRQYRTARSVLIDLWQLVAPFPPELADARLHVLVQSFRALRPDSKAIRPSDSFRWRTQRLRVKREMGRTFAMLKEWHQVQESVSWAKECVGLSPMWHVDNYGDKAFQY